MRTIIQIIDLLKSYGGIKNDSEVAKMIKLSPGALSNHKRRGTVPFEHLSTFCFEEQQSLDWLLTGPATGSGSTSGPKVVISEAKPLEAFKALKKLSEDEDENKAKISEPRSDTGYELLYNQLIQKNREDAIVRDKLIDSLEGQKKLLEKANSRLEDENARLLEALQRSGKLRGGQQSS